MVGDDASRSCDTGPHEGRDGLEMGLVSVDGIPRFIRPRDGGQGPHSKGEALHPAGQTSHGAPSIRGEDAYGMARLGEDSLEVTEKDRDTRNTAAIVGSAQGDTHGNRI